MRSHRVAGPDASMDGANSASHTEQHCQQVACSATGVLQ